MSTVPGQVPGSYLPKVGQTFSLRAARKSRSRTSGCGNGGRSICLAGTLGKCQLFASKADAHDIAYVSFFTLGSPNRTEQKVPLVAARFVDATPRNSDQPTSRDA